MVDRLLTATAFSHPNMPQLMGLSDDTTPVPFVLLTNVRTRTPEAKLLDALRRGSLAFCAELVLRLVCPPFLSGGRS